MITVRKLRTLLEEFPDDATCYAYEGEDTGITVKCVNPDTGVSEHYFIRCSDKSEEE